MQLRKILVPTDFSSASDAALGYATELAHSSGASLLILHVVEPPIPFCGIETLSPAVTLENRQENELLAQRVPQDKNVPYRQQLHWGLAADVILAVAESEAADLIVMGTHGRSGVSRLLMGSVAECVTRKATCPVLTLKQPMAIHDTKECETPDRAAFAK